MLLQLSPLLLFISGEEEEQVLSVASSFDPLRDNVNGDLVFVDLSFSTLALMGDVGAELVLLLNVLKVIFLTEFCLLGDGGGTAAVAITVDILLYVVVRNKSFGDFHVNKRG